MKVGRQRFWKGFLISLAVIDLFLASLKVLTLKHPAPD